MAALAKLITSTFPPVEKVGLIGFLLMITSCTSSATRTAKLPMGTVDQPTLGVVHNVSGKLEFLGWGFGEGRLREVNVYMNGEFVTSAVLGLSRPDVAAEFRNAAGSSNSGWQAILDVSSVSPGQYQFVIQGVTKAGSVRDFGVIAANVTKP